MFACRNILLSHKLITHINTTGLYQTNCRNRANTTQHNITTKFRTVTVQRPLSVNFIIKCKHFVRSGWALLLLLQHTRQRPRPRLRPHPPNLNLILLRKFSESRSNLLGCAPTTINHCVYKNDYPSSSSASCVSFGLCKHCG